MSMVDAFAKYHKLLVEELMAQTAKIIISDDF